MNDTECWYENISYLQKYIEESD